MVKSSKKKKKKAERKRKKLEEELTRTEGYQKLPPEVAENPKLPDTLVFLDGLNYQLIFERYNHKQCELGILNSKSAKLLINKLSMITKFNSKTLQSSHLVKDKVEKSGNYKALYEDLEDEIELVEIKFADTGRIFCYFVNDYPQGDNICNYCCIIAIKLKHI